MISGVDENATFNQKALTSSTKFAEKITIDGKEITIGFPGIFSGGGAELGVVHTCCGKYQDMRFGVVTSRSVEDDEILFYNGNVTKQMPTSGSATYQGHFVVAGETVQFNTNDYLKGTATFKADFSNKILSGTLSEPSLQPISVNAAINGNGFTGKVQSDSFRTTADVEGKFYGTNAKELGGIFIDNQKTWGGAFGAAQ